MAHTLFGLNVAERMNCQSCGLESGHLKYTAFFHYINASALRNVKVCYSELGGRQHFPSSFKLGFFRNHLVYSPITTSKLLQLEFKCGVQFFGNALACNSFIWTSLVCFGRMN